jgi:hypothetical protein
MHPARRLDLAIAVVLTVIPAVPVMGLAARVLRRGSLKYFHTDFAIRANHFDVTRLRQKIS